MSILITTAGSYGDVAPYTGLGVRLREAGYQVAVAAHDAYAPLVRDAGLEFRRLPAGPSGRGPAVRRRDLVRTAATFAKELGSALTEAVPAGAEMLLMSTTTAPLARHVAEALGIASLDVPLQPNAPTGDFAPPVGGARSLGRWGNRWAGRAALAMVDRVFGPAEAELRERLGLPRASARALRAREAAEGRTVLYGFSTAVVSRPTDWRPGLEVVGNWWPHHDPGGTLPPAVEDFLAVGAPPVFIGFGSMAAGEGERLGGLVVAALRRAGLRGILQSGRAGLRAESDEGVLTVGELPHALLFPRTAAVVHHAGAGTSAAALRAGVASVPVPVAADQPFWAGRLARLGAAVAPVPFAGLTADLLADALVRAVGDPSYAAAAAAAARRMSAEDGAGAVVGAVERLMP
ncbi:glycosyltransferase [Streptomyces sp. NPDC059165]|uniref:glycosyltransferase n=1 Tax=Streptomyces sp. NPDC059165 TaxID=3346751 RepID=UPI0036BDA076